MPRPRTGGFQRRDGKLLLRIPVTTLREGQPHTHRIWAEADPTLNDDEARALAQRMTEHFAGRVVDVQEVYRALRGEQAVTVRDFVRRVYLPTRKDQASWPRQCQWWELHILPVLGAEDVRTFGEEPLRELVRRLDAKVADPEVRFGWKTAQNVWGLVTRFCADLHLSKDEAVRVRPGNPPPSVRGPDRGDRSVKQWLYPVELHQLLACELIPVQRRRSYASQVFFFARPGELPPLNAKAIDLPHRLVTIDRSVDLRSRRLKHTKMHDVRVFPIELVILPMLEAMAAEPGGLKAGCLGLSDDGAAMLRADLWAAGVRRETLHERREPQVPITQHDLRATGITYLAMRGDTDDAVRERAGHTDFAMTQKYIRRGRRVAGANLGDPFAPLPESLCKLDGRRYRGRSGGGGANVSDTETDTPESENPVNHSDSRGKVSCEGEDSNLSHGVPQAGFSGFSGGRARRSHPKGAPSGAPVSDSLSETGGLLPGAWALAEAAARLGILPDRRVA